MEERKQKIINEIQNIMAKEKMSTTDLANNMGVSKQYISNLFNGFKTIKYDKLFQICEEGLGVNVKIIIDYQEIK